MEIKIKPYDPAKKAEVLQLVRLCLGEKADMDRDSLWWDWRHEANPFGRSLILTAEVDGQIVGVRPFLRWQLMCDERLVNAVKPVDTATHVDFRRQGIFTKLTRAALEQAKQQGVNLLFNTPNENSIAGYLKMGWKRAARLPLYVKALRPFRAFSRVLLSRLGLPPNSKPVTTTEQFDNLLPARRLLEGADTIAALDFHSNGNGDYHTPRTLEFLRWRYVDHPHATYYAEVDQQADKIAGVLFYRIKTRMNLREVLLDDLLTRDNRPETAIRLLNRLCRRVQADYIVAHFPKRSLPSAALRALGFWRVPGKRIQLVARGLDEGPSSAVIDNTNWALSMADIEGL